MQQVVARAITGGDRPFRVETLVCAAAHIDQDLAPWLAHLDMLGPEADAGIAALAGYWADDLSRGGEPQNLWWFPEDPAAPIRDWLYSDALHERLTRMDAGGQDQAGLRGW